MTSGSSKRRKRRERRRVAAVAEGADRPDDGGQPAEQHKQLEAGAANEADTRAARFRSKWGARRDWYWELYRDGKTKWNPDLTLALEARVSVAVAKDSFGASWLL